MQIGYFTVRKERGGRDFGDRSSELPSGGGPPVYFGRAAVPRNYLKGHHAKIQRACRAARVVRRGIDIRRSRPKRRSGPRALGAVHIRGVLGLSAGRPAARRAGSKSTCTWSGADRAERACGLLGPTRL